MQYQIIHTFEGFLSEEHTDETVSQSPKLILERLRYLRDCEIHGLVVNVGGSAYLDDEKSWTLLGQCLAVAKEMGFKIWLYDEKGYPSGSAGGLILRDEPQLEALGIKKDHEDYFIAPLYEGTHAERNYSEQRRYINLLDPKAVKSFFEVTHRKYASKLKEELMESIEAFFTDEPSLIAVVLPKLKGTQGKVVPVLDQPDLAASILPAIPFSYQLDDAYRKRFGQRLLEVAPQVMNHSEEPVAKKCSYWETVSLVYEEAYAKQLAAGCMELGKKLTGHILMEESPFGNMIFHANPFRVLNQFHLPGVDLLTNKLEDISIFGHKLPLSSAYLDHEGWIMTETSDFVEHRLGGQPASTHQMAAALSYQFLLGVREFSFYYDFQARRQSDYRWVNQLIQRTCDYAKGWKYQPQVALYCPYETFWAGYTPSATAYPDLLNEQPAFVQKAEASILELCAELFHRNIQFILSDHSSIQELMDRGITKIILPQAPVVAAEVIQAIKEGKLSVYGGVPQFVYSEGELLPAPKIEVKPLGSLEERPGFEYDSALRYAAFRGEKYYVYNPTGQGKRLMLTSERKIYDPLLDQELITDSQLMVQPGAGLFITPAS